MSKYSNVVGNKSSQCERRVIKYEWDGEKEPWGARFELGTLT